MGLRSLFTGGNKTASTITTGRTAKDRLRDSRNVRKADASTAAWLRAGGLAPRKGR
ncbi:hypothetical protein ACGF07_25585 [Kitasatospora sp. NPDC048194]|uniref:hypothetical protein n=1 Tax=Kitasatospora sp. NPDC048194 TaxID=3364045 RepID=UPI00372223DE